MAPTVYLFDIDGTLLSTGGAGRRAMSRAFDEVCGSADALAGIKLGGMTDRMILRAGFEAIGRSFEEALYQKVMTVYLAHLEGEVTRSTGYQVYDGVYAALDACEARAHSAIGLGTGNIEEGARVKLARGDLSRRFAFGGFGSDAEDRAELLEAGAQRGVQALGVARNDARVVVIGDTPRDVSAAHAIGARCITVTTGSFDAATLEEAGADAIFPSLQGTGAIEALLA